MHRQEGATEFHKYLAYTRLWAKAICIHVKLERLGDLGQE